jgi:adenylosuccinate synthase
VSELLDLEALKLRLVETLDNANAFITKVYGGEPMDLEAVFNKCAEWSLSLSSYIGAAEEILHDRLSDNEIVVLEGAQGALLDLDHGTYPFVTSSNPTIGGASVGLGLHPSQIAGVIGVFKAYCTRVGGGPFPTELTGETGERIRDLAQEFGTTTGRPRRVGWFDAIMANYSSKINGYTSVVLTRLDVLDGFDSIKICVGYELNGKRINRVPGGQGFLQHCVPIYEEYPGWDKPTAGATSFDQLPKKAVDYVMRLENLIGCPVDVISTGPKRHEAITRRSIL